VVGGPTPGDLGDLGALVGAEGRRAAAPVAGVERVEPVGVKVVDHVADPVRLTTDPESRRTIRSSRLPSSELISRTGTRSAVGSSGGKSEEADEDAVTASESPGP